MKLVFNFNGKEKWDKSDRLNELSLDMLIAGLRRTEPTSLEQLTQYISLHTSVKPRSTSLLPCPLSQESQLTYLQTYLSTLTRYLTRYLTRHISFYTMSTLDALNISGVPTYLIPSLLTQLLTYNTYMIISIASHRIASHRIAVQSIQSSPSYL